MTDRNDKERTEEIRPEEEEQLEQDMAAAAVEAEEVSPDLLDVDEPEDHFVDEMPTIALRGVMVFPSGMAHLDVGRSKSIAALDEAMLQNREISAKLCRNAEYRLQKAAGLRGGGVGDGQTRGAGAAQGRGPAGTPPPGAPSRR